MKKFILSAASIFTFSQFSIASSIKTEDDSKYRTLESHILSTSQNTEYDIDDQLSVKTNFRQDPSNGYFANIPLECIVLIHSKSDLSKKTYSLSRGFRALYLSGILPLHIVLNGQYDHRITSEEALRFRNIQSLSVRYLPIIEDLSRFSNVQCIFLDGVRGITDISPLENAKSVKLEGLDVTDVSALSDVPHVEISNLRKVSDFSALKNVKKLKIYSNNNISDVSVFDNVPNLSLGYLNNVKDISALANVPYLELAGLENVSDFSSLKGVKHLKLDSIDNIVDVSDFVGVENLSLSYLRNVTDVSALINVPFLTLIRMPQVDTSMLGNNDQILTIRKY